MFAIGSKQRPICPASRLSNPRFGVPTRAFLALVAHHASGHSGGNPRSTEASSDHSEAPILGPRYPWLPGPGRRVQTLRSQTLAYVRTVLYEAPSQASKFSIVVRRLYDNSCNDDKPASKPIAN
ncbi:hypothetical protein VOLCADRAFT_93144 [Volvox carteri f. nagariensis]|uniref:Uncharacterized protein n=1 Tax=Volvox carteri f. nagariensis TaxID=3068 RepID=D8U1F0_VOLCA|nr:uncharacterized protein VOLCADRAFT_93144 [Volvox carteri f. nagariensis]EFJ46327.1 hypothetical protein VOLCADRAFT_93144 [Volvox carteri f. nagariensis]|eukprot:XP_002952480.1 hypothetical protein VOLCADRAFT_93144 [Volvox carteri f. nagariensis]